MPNQLESYLKRLEQNLIAGNATEHTHRPALQELLQGLQPGLQVTNEPRHRTDCGAPDMVVLRSRAHLVIGHVETKDVGVPLAEAHKSDQLVRYRKYLPSLLLTDYLSFRWYVNGQQWSEASLGSADPRTGRVRTSGQLQQQTLKLLADFLARAPEPIRRPRELADCLARLAHMIRDIVVQAFVRREASTILRDLRQVLAEALIPDLADEQQTPQFADLYAQTLTYGLFAARCHHLRFGKGAFDLIKAAQEIPRTNPLLRQLFNAITGLDFDLEPYAGFVNELVAVLDHSAIDTVLEDFGQAGVRQDPVLHFYETFLSIYDPDVRERRGVYYTPEPVVGYIVRSVDQLLKSRFRIRDGLADTKKLDEQPAAKDRPALEGDRPHRTLILDPAAGTGTFLYEVIHQIRERFRQRRRAGLWNDYVHDHLLPRLFGFELLMAPYAIAHLKLGMQLAAQDLPELMRELFTYGFATDDRLQVYLTNTLEHVEQQAQQVIGGLQRAIADESRQAARAKRDLPILVVLGNPPYSGMSSNKGAWIDGLMKGRLPDGTATASYYHVDGRPLGERNPKWLQDDYVKFIRWGQWRLEQTGHGILAFITNHSYLDNPTFRGMRWALTRAFDEIYILDLHGGTKKKEVAPDGRPDQNVFDIRQGVSIGIFVKTRRISGGRSAAVRYAELWGERGEKYRWLDRHSVSATRWKKVVPSAPFYLFRPIDRTAVGGYMAWPTITEIMPIGSVGIVTARDSLTIQWAADDLWNVLTEFLRLSPEDTRVRFKLPADTRDWKVEFAKEDLRRTGPTKDRVVPLLYRPFDRRFTYYTDRSRGFLCMPRGDTMPHMLAGPNLGLISARSNKFPKPNHFFVARTVAEAKCGEASTQSCMFPLYLYPCVGKTDGMFETWPPGRDGRRPNLDPDYIRALEQETALEFVSDGRGNLRSTFGPEDVLAYIYAVFHWPEYRRRYAPMLRLDFPRVPPPGGRRPFIELARLGGELLAAHLLEDESLRGESLSYPRTGDNVVAAVFPRFVPAGEDSVRVGRFRLPADRAAGRVYINPDQFFEGVPPAVWDFQIGGYQVAEKWLKDRRGRCLEYDERIYYMRVIEALSKTVDLMVQIQAVAEQGGE